MTRFLIVDDNKDNLELLRSYLKTLDYEVASASNGKEALKIARENPPDMIISDILMPVMDGFTLCRECKSDSVLKSIPFIFYTATYTGPEDKTFALSLGAERFLIKPMDLISFTKEIHEVIEDFKADRLVATCEAVKEEKLILKEYNETLIRKLESKIGQLTKTNQLLENSLAERDRAEEVLKRSEALLRTTQHLAHIGGWEWNVEKQTMFWTEETYRIHDFEPGQFVPGTPEHITRSLECYLPEDRPVILDSFQQCVEKGQSYDLECRFTTAKGRQLWIRTIAKPVFESGKVVRVLGTIIDITERKRVSEQLIHSHDLMDYIISHARTAIAVHDKDLNYVYVSKRYLKDYKVKEQNVIGKHHYEVFPDLPQKWREVHQRSLNGEVLSEEEDPYFREDGSVDWTRWECRPWYESSGSIGGIIIYTEVINDRKKIEEDLRNRGNFIESIVNLSPDIIYIYDLVDKKNVYVNQGIQTVLGYSNEEIQKIGDQLIPVLMHPDDLKVYFDETVPRYAKAKDKELISHQYRMKHKNGHFSYLDCVELIYQRQPDGSPLQIFGVVHDITEHKKAEEQIQASLKEKEILLQEIHHRVKNNMAVISSLLSLQANSVEDNQIKDALKKAQNRVNAMSAVHETLHGSENLSEVNLKTYISKVTASIFQTYSITPGKVKLINNVEEIPISINQASPLGLVINELISNSLKYAFPDERKGEINVSLRKMDKEIELTVMDDGVGIPDGLDWKNSKSLGLKLVRTLAENQLNGSIDMENKVGAKFIIRFNIET